MSLYSRSSPTVIAKLIHAKFPGSFLRITEKRFLQTRKQLLEKNIPKCIAWGTKVLQMAILTGLFFFLVFEGEQISKN